MAQSRGSSIFMMKIYLKLATPTEPCQREFYTHGGLWFYILDTENLNKLAVAEVLFANQPGLVLLDAQQVQAFGNDLRFPGSNCVVNPSPEIWQTGFSVAPSLR